MSLISLLCCPWKKRERGHKNFIDEVVAYKFSIIHKCRVVDMRILGRNVVG